MVLWLMLSSDRYIDSYVNQYYGRVAVENDLSLANYCYKLEIDTVGNYPTLKYNFEITPLYGWEEKIKTQKPFKPNPADNLRPNR